MTRNLDKELGKIFKRHCRKLPERGACAPPVSTHTNWQKITDDSPPSDMRGLWNKPVTPIMAEIMDLARKTPLKEEGEESDISDNVYMMF